MTPPTGMLWPACLGRAVARRPTTGPRPVTPSRRGSRSRRRSQPALQGQGQLTARTGTPESGHTCHNVRHDHVGIEGGTRGETAACPGSGGGDYTQGRTLIHCAGGPAFRFWERLPGKSRLRSRSPAECGGITQSNGAGGRFSTLDPRPWARHPRAQAKPPLGVDEVGGFDGQSVSCAVCHGRLRAHPIRRRTASCLWIKEIAHECPDRVSREHDPRRGAAREGQALGAVHPPERRMTYVREP